MEIVGRAERDWKTVDYLFVGVEEGVRMQNWYNASTCWPSLEMCRKEKGGERAILCKRHRQWR